MTVSLHLGDCIEVMSHLEENSVDTVITDPPYGLSKEPDIAEVMRAWLDDKPYEHNGKGFMGKSWDSFVPGPRYWKEVYRVLKPGGTLLCFASTRTFDLMGISIRFAGFEMHPFLVWINGQGFPKATNVSKMLDRQRNDDLYPVTQFVADARDKAEISNGDIDKRFGFHGMAGHWTSQKSQPSIPTWDHWQQLKTLLGFGDDMDAEVWRLNGRKGKPGDAWSEREDFGAHPNPNSTGWVTAGKAKDGRARITAPATDAAKLWDGWYYGKQSLKPAVEPILMAQKPMDGTGFHNAIEWGVAGLNVDGSRIGTGSTMVKRKHIGAKTGANGIYGSSSGIKDTGSLSGRFPANLILSHSPECKMALDVKHSGDSAPNRIYVTIVKDAIDGHVVTVEQLINGDIPGLTPGSVVSVGSIKLNNDSCVGKEEIDNESPTRSKNDVLMDKGDACASHLVSDCQLGFRNSEQTILDGIGSIEGHMRQDLPSFVYPGTLDGAAKGRLGSTDTVALDSESAPTDRTLKSDAGVGLLAAQDVGTAPRTSNVSPDSEFSIGDTIDGVANGTCSGMSWHIITSKDNYTTLLRSGQVIPDYECVPNCAIRLLGEQSGTRHAYCSNPETAKIAGARHVSARGAVYGEYNDKDYRPLYSDTGTSARFFLNLDGETRFFYCAKSSRRERNAGLEGADIKAVHRYGPGIGEGKDPGAPAMDQNHHPTCKPLKLMEYLCTLTKTPTGGVVLDPFLGSGTTGIAAVNTGRDFIGIELEPDYFEIAGRRIEHAQIEARQLELI